LLISFLYCNEERRQPWPTSTLPNFFQHSSDLVTDVGSRSWLGSTVSSCGAAPSASTPFDSTLVLGFTTGNERTLAGLGRAFERASDCTVRTVGLLRQMHSGSRPWDARGSRRPDGGHHGGRNRARRHILSSFRDVLSIESTTRRLDDSTLLRLNDFLAKSFPATRTNPTLAAR
jgi:hypothetical protein